MQTVKTKVLIGFCALAVFSFSLWSLTWAWADINAYAANKLMGDWKTARKQFDQLEWEGAYTQLNIAQRLNPLNADYAADLGAMAEWRALQHPTWSAEAHRYRSQAIQHFRDALQRRPGWALAWINLAYSKVLNHELDDETIKAIEKAMVLGRWEGAVQKKFIWIGMSAWESLTPELKQQLFLTINGALRYHWVDQHVLVTAVHMGWEDKLRPMLIEARHIAMLDGLLRKRRSRNIQ